MSKKSCMNCKYTACDTDTEPCSKCRFGKGGDYPIIWEPKEKDSMADQTAKQDNGKPQYTLVPTGIIKAVEKIRAYGNEKYHDPQNWKSVESQRFWDAAVRHIVAAWDDYTAIDPESGLPHIYHAMCNLAFLAERMEKDT